MGSRTIYLAKTCRKPTRREVIRKKRGGAMKLNDGKGGPKGENVIPETRHITR